MNVITAYITKSVMSNTSATANTIAELWRAAKAAGRMSYVTDNMRLFKAETTRELMNVTGPLPSDVARIERYVKTNPESRKGFGARGSANEVCRWRVEKTLVADETAPAGEVWTSKWWFNDYDSVIVSNVAKAIAIYPGGETLLYDWTAFNDSDEPYSNLYPNTGTLRDIAKGTESVSDYSTLKIQPDVFASTVPHFRTITQANDYRQKASGYYYNNSPTIEEFTSFLEQNLEDIPPVQEN